VHGQKKRRKRTLQGTITVEDLILNWRLVSEPLWSTDHGYKGVCIAVQTEDETGRELILQYPYPTNSFGSPLPLPQRPRVSEKSIQEDVRQALVNGWDPQSRGKAIVNLLS
jgi:hypothetical protein